MPEQRGPCSDQATSWTTNKSPFSFQHRQDISLSSKAELRDPPIFLVNLYQSFVPGSKAAGV
jgi:hypothetical protein